MIHSQEDASKKNLQNIYFVVKSLFHRQTTNKIKENAQIKQIISSGKFKFSQWIIVECENIFASVPVVMLIFR